MSRPRLASLSMRLFCVTRWKFCLESSDRFMVGKVLLLHKTFVFPFLTDFFGGSMVGRGKKSARARRAWCRIEYIICPCSMPIFFSLFMAAKSSWEGSRQQLLKEARKWAQKRGTGPISHSTREAQWVQCEDLANQLPNWNPNWALLKKTDDLKIRKHFYEVRCWADNEAWNKNGVFTSYLGYFLSRKKRQIRYKKSSSVLQK